LGTLALLSRAIHRHHESDVDEPAGRGAVRIGELLELMICPI
jgi:hypothetical protein